MALRFLLLGMNGAMTQAALQGLLGAGHRPVAILLPDGAANSPPQHLAAPLPPADESAIFELLQVTTALLARDNQIPLWITGTLNSSAAQNWLTAQQVDLIVVACFPWLIPPFWLNQPRLGALNVHPSMLPAFRGPAPFFWQLREGVEQTGVTIHQMSEQLDKGDILAQSSWAWKEGWREEQANSVAGLRGGQLLGELLDRPVDEWRRTPQDETQATYQANPTAADRQISTSWSARRVYNFVRGTSAWGSCWLEVEGKTIWLDRVAEWEPAGSQAAPHIWLENRLRVAFNPGVVEFAVKF